MGLRMMVAVTVPVALAGCAAVTVVDTAVDAAATTAGAAVDLTGAAVDAAVPDDEDD